MARYVKDPQARLDYVFDWREWLDEGDTITTYTVVAEDGLTVNDVTEVAGKVIFWAEGGTVGLSYIVTAHIETSAGRQDDRQMTIAIRQR